MDKPKKQQAQITVVDVPDGAKVTIEYADGHVVRLDVGPDSQVLRKYFGFEDLPETADKD